MRMDDVLTMPDPTIVAEDDPIYMEKLARLEARRAADKRFSQPVANMQLLLVLRKAMHLLALLCFSLLRCGVFVLLRSKLSIAVLLRATRVALRAFGSAVAKTDSFSAGSFTHFVSN